jgi:TolB-like protein/DNA-binding winged helix-turn-helix (wHTH) protein/cytochrome c-type biogenesis protein CcmH/NrfG
MTNPKPLAPVAADTYRFLEFELDARNACLRRGATPVPLRPKSFDVLLYLVRHRGRLVTKDELIEAVWAPVVVTENSLVQCIREAREAIGDSGQARIETVAKRGYIFTAEVIEGPADTGPPATAPRRARYALGVAALVAAGGVAAWIALETGAFRDGLPGLEAPARRFPVAVLPFDAPGGPSPEADYFSRGISDDIAAALGRFPEFAVAAPLAVARQRTAGASAEDLQRQLRLRYLVEGSVRRSPDRIRIAVRLTDLPQGVLLWSQTYDAAPSEIFKIEDDIAARIAGALSVKVSSLERQRAAGRPAASMEAYDFVLRGRELLTRLDRRTHSEARSMFERAIELDPRQAGAMVGLGRLDLSAVALGWTGDPDAALKRAGDLARAAIALDESHPAAHVLLGRTYSRMGDPERAVETLGRAIALNRSDPDSHAGLGDALLWSGDARGAIRSLEAAIAMDPQLSAEDLFSLGAAYFMDGRPADAIRVLERATTRNEANPFIFALLAAGYAEAGREPESRFAAANARRMNPFFDSENFGSLFKVAAQREKLARALKQAGL